MSANGRPRSANPGAQHMNEPIYIVDGARTPFLKSRNRPGPFSASDLATAAGRALLVRQPFAPTELDEVILGCAAPSVDEVNIGRVVALRMGCGMKVPGWTVMRNCASGMQALDSAINNIRAGRSNLVLAGGVDALSRVPLLYSDAMVVWLANWYAAKTLGQRAALAAKFKLGYLAPVIGIMKGLTDPMVGLLMGQTAENLAFRFGITRREMDEFAARSHAARARGAEGRALRRRGRAAVRREGHALRAGRRRARGLDRREPREAQAVLRPQVRQRHGGQQLADHRRRGVAPDRVGARGRRAQADADRPHRRLGMGGARSRRRWASGPVHAATPILQRHGLGLNDLDAWEINEAFAAQVIGCERAWQDADYCTKELGLPSALGALDEGKLNVDGGAIALGHPVGASGARIVLHVLNVLKRTGGRRGMAAICIGGGLGGAMLVERA